MTVKGSILSEGQYQAVLKKSKTYVTHPKMHKEFTWAVRNIELFNFKSNVSNLDLIFPTDCVPKWVFKGFLSFLRAKETFPY